MHSVKQGPGYTDPVTTDGLGRRYSTSYKKAHRRILTDAMVHEEEEYRKYRARIEAEQLQTQELNARPSFWGSIFWRELWSALRGKQPPVDCNGDPQDARIWRKVALGRWRRYFIGEEHL